MWWSSALRLTSFLPRTPLADSNERAMRMALEICGCSSSTSLLLGSDGAATGPWTWLASKDRDGPASVITAMAVQFGYRGTLPATTADKPMAFRPRDRAVFHPPP